MKKFLPVIILCLSFSAVFAVGKDYAYDNTKVTAEQMEVFKEIMSVDPGYEKDIKFYNSDSDDWFVKDYQPQTEEDTKKYSKKPHSCYELKLNRPSNNIVSMRVCVKTDWKGEVIRPINEFSSTMRFEVTWKK